MAEDDEDDREFMTAAFRDADVPWRLEFVNDGLELIEYLRRGEEVVAAQLPAIIVLDLNMPRKDGREALSEIKADEALREIPVLVLSTSREAEDVRLSYRAGASSFISKPVTHAGMVEVVRQVREYWIDLVKLPGVVSWDE